jgi:CO dehydrogenase/acetyl-CoA synthase gamma subunit (corrinoid Fe-S protein)
MIFWSHFKTMTCEPGVIPKNVNELHYKRLPKDLRKMIKTVGERMKELEHIILEEKKAEIDGSEVIDKSQLRQLNLGAEMTSSSDECDEDNHTRRRGAKVSGSMQRSIDRLLRSTLDD